MENFTPHSLHARMRRYGAAVRRRRLDARRSLLQNPFDDPHSFTPSGRSTYVPTATASTNSATGCRSAACCRCSSAPVTYKSKGLADYLGLKNLYITFNGYYPEIGAKMTTCSFKETEAYSVCARIREGDKPDSGGRLGRQYGARLRQSLLGQQHSAAVVGARREHLGALVRPAAQPLRSN